MEAGTVAGGAGLTAAFAAVLYGISKWIKRSRCKSHTQCCDVEMAREQTERNNAEIVDVVLAALAKKDGEPALKKVPEDGKIKANQVIQETEL
jgi:hypothetical protein